MGIVGIWLTFSLLYSGPGASYTYTSFVVVWATLVLVTNLWTVCMISSVY